MDPSQPAAALLLERPARAAAAGQPWRLLRVAVGGEETLVLHEDPRPIVDAAIGEDGALSRLLLAEDEGHSLYRGSDRGAREPVLRCERMRRCGLLGAAPDGGLWLWSNVEGDRSALLHVDAQGRPQRRHEDPRAEADLADVALDPVDGRPRSPTAARCRSCSRWSAKTIHAWPRSSASFRPRCRSRRAATAGWCRSAATPARRTLVVGRCPGPAVRSAGRCGLHLRRQAPPAAGRSGDGAQGPRYWPASDGRWPYGFLTLPPGVDVAKAPMVVIVHGGPFGQVRPDFSGDPRRCWPTAATWCSSRISAAPPGWAATTCWSSQGDFGNGRVQRDIVEGTQWLLAHGVGDATRVGIAGASFGGYSALLGVTFQPQLFRVAVARAAGGFFLRAAGLPSAPGRKCSPASRWR